MTDAEAKAPVLWPSDMNSQLIGRDLVLGKIEDKKRKGATEDEVVKWHH